MLSPSLFAQGGKPVGRLLDDPNFWFGVGGLAGAMIVGAVALYFLERWRKQPALDQKPAGAELTDFRTMYERGEITEAEYTRLRLKVAERVKTAPVPNAPGGSAPPAATPPAVPAPFPPGYFDDPPRPPGLGGTPGAKPSSNGTRPEETPPPA